MFETNLQNIPRAEKIKRMYVPRQGYFFLEADLSQAESRIVAWLAGEVKLIEMYTKNEDVHSYVASMVFGKPVKKGDPERQVGKTVGHASNYDMKWRKLADIVYKETDIELEAAEAKRVQRRYFQAFPGIRSVFQLGVRRELKENNHVLVNPFGRKKKFWNPWGDELFRQAYSHIPQSTVADVINHGLLNFVETFTDTSVRLVAQVHDSLLFEVSSFYTGLDLAELIKRIEVCMSIPFTIHGRPITIPVEFKLGNTWGTLKDWKGAGGV